MNIGKFHYVRLDAAVVETAKSRQAAVKVILETSLLSPEQWVTGSELAVGADFVKTSTGFNGSGASLEAVGVLVGAVNGRAEVKASGGIRDWTTAAAFAQAGATRLGVGAGPQILQGAPSPKTY